MKCFYVPGSTSIYDTINEEGLSSVYSKTIEAIRETNPDIEIWDLDEAVEWIQKVSYAKYITPPVEITKKRWWEMLEVMPPMRWRGGDSTESFMICEATTLDLHSTFCRIGERYFEMTNQRSLSHDEIVLICQPLTEDKTL